MVRSLYAGVAGMTTHQTKMDVIGNNIANVSTYGYKSSRASFRDVYYQTTTNASGATAQSGGQNATQIGYGSKLASVDVNHAQSIMSTTGYSMDVAITGEGYIQVMDPDGNIFYTKAGLLDIDAEGNFVDANGNFVLGVSGNPTGQEPASNKIKINLPFLNPSTSSAENRINGIDFTIKSSETNTYGNLNMAFTFSTALPVGQRAEAVVASNSVLIRVNPNENFESIQDFQNAVNDAITRANGGTEHPAGDFLITMNDPAKFADGLSGLEIVGSNFGIQPGSVTVPPGLSSYFSVSSVNDAFTGNDPNANMSLALDANNNLTINVGPYSAIVTESQLETAGSVVLKRNGTDNADAFIITYPSLNTINAYNLTALTGAATMLPSEPSKQLGLSSMNFSLKDGTEGGAQTIANLTGIGIGQNGIISAIHPSMGQIEIGRIDLATFQNPSGLLQVGNTYFAVSANSGDPLLTQPGVNGTGSLAAGTLEASNVDLSNEFANMITTQRGFQACSRLITVSDTMLEELINLKR